MGKLVVTEFVSIDGVIQDPGGDSDYRHGGWTFDIETDQAVYEFKSSELEQADVLLLGKKTYEGFAAAWPQRAGVDAFADKMNTMPKYVVSTTLTNPAWENTTVISSDVVESVRRLKEQPGGDILVEGSANLVATLHRHNLVDEYRLMLFPVVLGNGQRLFPDDAEDKLNLNLSDSRPFTNGVVLNTYTPAG